MPDQNNPMEKFLRVINRELALGPHALSLIRKEAKKMIAEEISLYVICKT